MKASSIHKDVRVYGRWGHLYCFQPLTAWSKRSRYWKGVTCKKCLKARSKCQR